MLEFTFVLIYLCLPAAVLWLVAQHSWAERIGSIVLCYSIGILMGNLGFIPSSIEPLQITLSEMSIALAFPMLLFTLNVREWSAMAGKAMLSLVIATMSVMTLSTSLYFFFADQNTLQNSHLAAMSVGVYTGGTPNLAAIKTGLDIPNDLYLLFHSFDTLLGAVYMLFMVSIAIPFFRRFLAMPDEANRSTDSQDQAGKTTPYDENYSVLLKRRHFPQIVKCLTLAGLVLGLSLASAEAVKSMSGLQSTGALSILFLTTFGILLSLLTRVRALTLAYKLGMYLILVFCIVVASLADLHTLLDFDSTVGLFLFGTVFGSLILHALLCKLAKVDSDTFMVTSVSAICSPPFVPMMVKALNNPNVLLSGLTTGIIGLAMGNYLGISLALFLQSLN